MPTIELTDEQAEELRGVLQTEVNGAATEMRRYDPQDADYIWYQHYHSVLSDILHLLEIA